jgi:abortive infection bacteriophage resistance protein
VGDYRLGFYSFPFEKTFPSLRNRNHKLCKGTSFKEIVDLYYFDYDLRRVLLNALNRIEVNIRTTITYIISNHYKNSPTWFVDPAIMLSSFINTFDDMVYAQISKNPVILRHHKTHINDRYAPAWKTLEFMTIGNVCMLYKSLRDKDVQLQIANKYGCTIGIFKNYLETIMFIRNKCAHGSCLYNITLPLGVKVHPANVDNQSRQYVSGIIGVIDYILGKISINRQKELEQDINHLVNIKRSGKTNQIIKDCSKIHLLNFVDWK